MVSKLALPQIIGVGRFRILGVGGVRFRILGARFRILVGAMFRILGGGGEGGQIPSRHMTS